MQELICQEGRVRESCLCRGLRED